MAAIALGISIDHLGTVLCIVGTNTYCTELNFWVCFLICKIKGLDKTEQIHLLVLNIIILQKYSRNSQNKYFFLRIIKKKTMNNVLG